MQIDYAALAPEIIVTAAACLVLLIDLVLRGRARVLTAYIGLASVLLALVIVAFKVGSEATTTLGGLFVLDGFAVVMKLIFLATAAFVIWVSIPPMRGHRYEGEYVFLLLCSVLGTMLMPSSRDLLMLFIALELVSAPAFVIAGLRKLNPRSNEAALKYFIFGVLSAGVFVYGISLVYGAIGATDLNEIAARLQGAGPTGVSALLLTGIVFIIAAFGFKVSAVPFHFWAPDTYEGSPTPLAAFLSVGSKASGFVGLLLILLIGFPNLSSDWGPYVGAIAMATMIVGNVVALRQRHLIRLLAYSSIGHAGYMLIPIAVIQPHTGEVTGANADLVQSLVTYLAVYAVMTLGAFAVAIGISKQYPTLLIRDLAGLGRRAPLPAIALAGFLISLGGIPPFAGWFAKFSVFTAAIGAGSTLGVVLAAMMVVTSVISLYYYVGVIRVIFLEIPEDETAVRLPRPITLATAVTSIGVVVLGIYPEPIARLANAARLVLAG
ncbi:MAG: NADH-quinone oxidoreductase subunit N [Actinomycetota bacterium]